MTNDNLLNVTKVYKDYNLYTGPYGLWIISDEAKGKNCIFKLAINPDKGNYKGPITIGLRNTSKNTWVGGFSMLKRIENIDNTYTYDNASVPDDGDTYGIIAYRGIVDAVEDDTKINIRYAKLEVGDTATKWIPNKSDVIYKDYMTTKGVIV